MGETAGVVQNDNSRLRDIYFYKDYTSKSTSRIGK